MKINNNCARMILKEVENIPFGETVTVCKLQERIPEYSIEDVLSIVTLFNHDRYLTILDKVGYDDNDVLRDNKIKCLTDKGYKALDLIRDDELWDSIMAKIPNAENLSIYTLLDVASKINNDKQNKIFNLPDNAVHTNMRW